MSFKFRRSDKQALEQALSETIDSALCYPEPADRLQYVGAALASKVGETAPQPDAEQGESPTPNRQRRYVTELQTSISTALAEAVRKPDDGRPIMAVVAESLQEQSGSFKKRRAATPPVNSSSKKPLENPGYAPSPSPSRPSRPTCIFIFFRPR